MTLPRPLEDIDIVEIKCPNCGKTNITVCEDSHGHYQVTSCYDCGYKTECTLKD